METTGDGIGVADEISQFIVYQLTRQNSCLILVLAIRLLQPGSHLGGGNLRAVLKWFGIRDGV